MQVTSSTDQALKPTAIALGNFDGIHRGHQKVMESILDAASGKSSFATVVSFHPHPREFFTGKSLKLLTPLEEKAQQLKLLGIKQLVLLPFSQKLAIMSPQEFVKAILVEQLQATHISVGEDFRFGNQRRGTIEDLQRIGSQFGIEVIITDSHHCRGEDGTDPSIRISSSLIREALTQGNIEQANRLLGRAYTLTGKVVEGQQLGRKIGFPTANLALPPEKFLPRQGVYCVNVSWQTEVGEEFQVNGVMNIGCRPTVEGTDSTVEVHLLNWGGNLYNQEITVSIAKFVRSEQKFPSLDALKSQIAADCEVARKYFLDVLPPLSS